MNEEKDALLTPDFWDTLRKDFSQNPDVNPTIYLILSNQLILAERILNIEKYILEKEGSDDR